MRAGWALEDPRRLRFVLGSAALSCAALALLLASAPASAAGAGPGFSAHGSVEQVYVTGLSPRRGCRSLNRSGQAVATKRADAQGGLLFRNVKPGTGYRVRPAGRRADVGAADGALDATGAAEHGRLQPDDPAEGYGYLTTRDGTKLAIDVHPPQDVTNAVPGVDLPPAPSRPDPDPDRVLGLRLRRPGRPAERDRDPRQPHGVHGGRREHARHRLLGRRVRLLRAAAEPRRLRRDRDDRPPAVGAASQGRDDGHLLRRDQPALHRRRPTRRAWPRSRRSRCSTRRRRPSIRAAS